MPKTKIAQPPEEILINPNDFGSISTRITVKNSLTGGELRNRGSVKLVEFLERGMLLEIPSRFCQKSHYLVLTLEVTTPGKRDKMIFNTGAKVETLETLPSGVDLITVSLIQHEVKAWEALQNLFSARQNQILEFFTAAKGE